MLACFRDSVLLGRPAEAVIASFGTEGGEVLDIVRFAGEGALTRYRKADGRWVRQNGSLVLDPPAGSWAFAAWDAGEPVE